MEVEAVAVADVCAPDAPAWASARASIRADSRQTAPRPPVLAAKLPDHPPLQTHPGQGTRETRGQLRIAPAQQKQEVALTLELTQHHHTGTVPVLLHVPATRDLPDQVRLRSADVTLGIGGLEQGIVLEEVGVGDQVLGRAHGEAEALLDEGLDVVVAGQGEGVGLADVAQQAGEEGVQGSPKPVDLLQAI